MSLNLDLRRRAMLQDMGVRVWQPEPAPIASEAIAINQDSKKPKASFDSNVAPLSPATSARASAPAPHPSTAPVPAAASALAHGKGVVELGALPAGIDQMDWSALQAAVANCQACALCQSRKQTVFGSGSHQARWLVVGEAPGEQEDLQGQPFVGPAGQLLGNMLQAAGLSRSGEEDNGVYITNVLKCRPPGNRNPNAQEMKQCDAYLRRQVQLLQPHIILALGRFAAQSLLQHSVPDVANIPLGKLRAQVHRYQGVPVIVSYHPAYLLRSLGEKAKAWADLCLAMDVMQGKSASSAQTAQ
jgi:uracil-DNA glycosylase